MAPSIFISIVNDNLSLRTNTNSIFLYILLYRFSTYDSDRPMNSIYFLSHFTCVSLRWRHFSTASTWTRGTWTCARYRGGTRATRQTVRPTRWCRYRRPPDRSPRGLTLCTCRARRRESRLETGPGRFPGTSVASVRQNRLWSYHHPIKVSTVLRIIKIRWIIWQKFPNISFFWGAGWWRNYITPM